MNVCVDANVLGHGCNPHDLNHESSLRFLLCLLESDCKLACNNGFSLIDQENLSIVGREYIDNLTPGSIPAAVIAAMAQTGRLVYFDDAVDQRTRNVLNQNIPKSSDRTYARIALNASAPLISHDFADFSNRTRKTLLKELALLVLTAAQQADAQGCESVDQLLDRTSELLDVA